MFEGVAWSFMLGIRYFSRYPPPRVLLDLVLIKGKLSPRYIGPFPILARIGRLAYHLDFPDSMKGVHNVFHVSMLRKYLRDPEHHVILEPVTIEQDLTIEARPVRILEESERVLRRQTLKYVRVLWTNQTEREATRELESQMREKYPEGEYPSFFFLCNVESLFRTIE